MTSTRCSICGGDRPYLGYSGGCNGEHEYGKCDRECPPKKKTRETIQYEDDTLKEKLEEKDSDRKEADK